MPLLLLLCVLPLIGLFAKEAWADSHPNVNLPGQVFTSPQGAATLTLDKELKSAVVVAATRRYDLDFHLLPEVGRDGDFYVSDSGALIVWVRKGHFYGHPDEKEIRGLTAVIFYREGKPVRTLGYAELMQRPELATQSVSHTNWLKQVAVDWQSGELRLVTMSFRRYVFDVQTGKPREAGLLPSYARAAFIVYGKLTRSGETGGRLEVFRYLKGEGPPFINVTLGTARWLPDYAKQYVLQKSLGTWTLVGEYVDETEQQAAPEQKPVSRDQIKWPVWIVPGAAVSRSGDGLIISRSAAKTPEPAVLVIVIFDLDVATNTPFKAAVAMNLSAASSAGFRRDAAEIFIYEESLGKWRTESAAPNLSAIAAGAANIEGAYNFSADLPLTAKKLHWFHDGVLRLKDNPVTFIRAEPVSILRSVLGSLQLRQTIFRD